MFDWFYSDPHFGHKRICELAYRPFASAEEMNAELVRRYQESVRSSDLVLWCGDCFFTSFEESKKILSSLPGRKALVIGNHDRSAARMAAMGFEIVVSELQLRVGDHPVRVSHYPYQYASRPEDEKRYVKRMPQPKPGEALIHGHTHSKKRVNGRAIHVGVDAWDFAPVHCSEVIDLVENVLRKGGE